MARPSLTRRRLLGLDRTGPPPAETVAGAPLNPWTLPNLIGYIRIALIPVFLVLALGSGDGRDTAATTIYAVIGATDYLDGITARVTGQYSRLGTLLDPLVDRLLVLSGVVVTYHFELLPRWALIVLAARELVMLVLTQVGMRRGMDLKVNMVGRWAVWPTMFSIFLAMVSTTWIADALLYLGLGMTLWATALYLGDGWKAMHQNTQA
ncbi:MAG TPA: CDP-alcohol phosphatidyltransferase family protein [Thermoleophilaceae bacterium]|nr:CDP-alcohol phosphatidyltransferase family protein [Thermoleophilaceae bacterium]